MKRYFFQISYNGKNYHGWQRQINAISIQETLETCFSKLYSNVEISIVGCGRTDTGVHANSYFFHVDLENVGDTLFLVVRLNKMLPESIYVKEMVEVNSNLHARFDAIKRTYRYFLHQKKDPFKEDFSWYFPQEINLEKMNEAATFLIGEKDFCSFAKVHTDVKTTICSVYSAKWHVSEKGIYFEISANRFLRNMVRAIVGTLLEVGLNKIEAQEINTVLEAKNRQEAAVSVPAHGLFLWEVTY